jgi:hypothetical protein
MATADREVNRYPVPTFNSGRAWADVYHFPGGLVTRDNKTGFGSPATYNRLSVVDAHITATQRGSPHLNEHLAKARYRVRAIDHIYIFIPGK